MVHIDPDYPTKKAFKEAFAKGKDIYTYSPGPFPSPSEGRVVVEAPARYHKWYATVIVKNNKIIKIVG
jgi:hypothetical protein